MQSRIRAWVATYLMPQPTGQGAVLDENGTGYWRHREVIMSSSREEVLRELMQRSATPISIEPQRESLLGPGRVSPEFKKQLITTLMFSVEGGMSSGRALEDLIEQETGPVRPRLNYALDALKRGRPFLEAFEALGMFDETTMAIVEAGEETGRLPEALRSAAEHLDRSAGAQKLILGAVTATVLDMVFAVTSVFGVRFGLIPQLKEDAETSKLSPDKKAEFEAAIELATVGNDIMIGLTALLLVAVGVLVYAYMMRPSPEFRAKVDNAVLRIPVLRSLLMHTAVSSTTGVMSSLLRGGVNFLRASAITERGTKTPPVANYWAGARTSIEAGRPISESIAASPLTRSEQMMLLAHRDVKQLATSFGIVSSQRDEVAKKAAKRFGIVAFLAAMVYSVVSALLALYAVFVQNASLLSSTTVGG